MLVHAASFSPNAQNLLHPHFVPFAAWHDALTYFRNIYLYMYLFLVTLYLVLGKVNPPDVQLNINGTKIYA